MLEDHITPPFTSENVLLLSGLNLPLNTPTGTPSDGVLASQIQTTTANTWRHRPCPD
ncbi:hypothetical protein NQZ68_040404 [Dissostichus eleginoides]|nr:hypothetical protein NQZ68_040404 [Dissostichus eleginoides]